MRESNKPKNKFADGTTDGEGQAVNEDQVRDVEEVQQRSATAVKEPIALKGPFTVSGGNVVDAGGNVVAICGFDHNRASSGPAVAGAVMTALNRLYRTPLPEEPVKP